MGEKYRKKAVLRRTLRPGMVSLHNFLGLNVFPTSLKFVAETQNGEFPE